MRTDNYMFSLRRYATTALMKEGGLGDGCHEALYLCLFAPFLKGGRFIFVQHYQPPKHF